MSLHNVSSQNPLRCSRQSSFTDSAPPNCSIACRLAPFARHSCSYVGSRLLLDVKAKLVAQLALPLAAPEPSLQEPHASRSIAFVHLESRSSQSGPLHPLQNQRHRRRQPLPVRQFLFELRAPFFRQRIEFRASIVVGCAPLRPNEPSALEPVERWIERPL